jgi:hypothetical protein
MHVILKKMHKILVESLEGRDHMGDISLDGKIPLKWNLKKCVGEYR